MNISRFFAALISLSAITTLPGSAVIAESALTRTEITLSNFSFTPSDIHLHAGKKVTLHFVNTGSGGHDFTAPEFFAGAQMDPATRTKLGKKGKVSLEKGQSADITLTPNAGSYKAKCSHFLHAGFGMTGKITVE